MPSYAKAFFWASLASLVIADTEPDYYDWDMIEPSRDLRFASCYDGKFQCARLLTPLDWDGSEAHSNATVAIAIIKVPATVSPDDDRYGGTVIVNPGGPGDSGVLHVLRNGHLLQNMMSGDNKKFDLMSFDPRGVSHTTPKADCFTSEVARTVYDWQIDALGNIQAAKEYIENRRKFYTAFGLQCAAFKPDGIPIHEFTSTASVARDMLRMVDEIDKLHQKQLRELGEGSSGHSIGAQEPLSFSKAAVPRLQYYGTSYGTVLGNTFLSMFPGRVKRMILDGNVVGEEWVASVSRVLSGTLFPLQSDLPILSSRIGTATLPIQHPQSTTFTKLASKQRLNVHYSENPTTLEARSRKG